MDETGTTLSIGFGDLTIDVTTTAPWTPELIDHTLTRMRRHLVAGARQLGLDQPLEADTVEP
jgi:hypothetical protein